jgi:hypothetical protein
MASLVIRAIPKENPLMTPKVYEESRLKDMRKAAVIVIISDVYEGVSGEKFFKVAGCISGFIDEIYISSYRLKQFKSMETKNFFLSVMPNDFSSDSVNIIDG